ncbi:alpha/beta hydrolase [Shouchella hunanensis]|uniref:Dienelactone hydrolase family protein n=1 Tax=Shouchella hunanensis TaxID=766894 RepID=A0ABY7W789_9BACI|nr:dienelactone hydrolase family protein [Shouchella hunanensis]WDF04805.1 dienelactone hydrolase family protein [Shouchella hunanensis]
MHYFYHRSQTSTDTFILLHGSAGRESDLLDIAGDLDVSFSVIGLRGEVRDEKGFRYFSRPIKGAFDYEDISYRTEQIHQTIDTLLAEKELPHGKRHLIGYSNGANIATSLLLTHPNDYTSAVLFHPSNLFHNPKEVHLSHTKIFISAGATDTLVAPGEAFALQTQLNQFGAETKLSLTDYGHALINADIEEATKWWKSIYGGAI